MLSYMRNIFHHNNIKIQKIWKGNLVLKYWLSSKTIRAHHNCLTFLLSISYDNISLPKMKLFKIGLNRINKKIIRYDFLSFPDKKIECMYDEVI